MINGHSDGRLTTAITTLDYCISWFSLHAAHLVGYKERGTNLIAANVSRHCVAPNASMVSQP